MYLIFNTKTQSYLPESCSHCYVRQQGYDTTAVEAGLTAVADYMQARCHETTVTPIMEIILSNKTLSRPMLRRDLTQAWIRAISLCYGYAVKHVGFVQIELHEIVVTDAEAEDMCHYDIDSVQIVAKRNLDIELVRELWQTAPLQMDYVLAMIWQSDDICLYHDIQDRLYSEPLPQLNLALQIMSPAKLKFWIQQGLSMDIVWRIIEYMSRIYSHTDVLQLVTDPDFVANVPNHGYDLVPVLINICRNLQQICMIQQCGYVLHSDKPYPNYTIVVEHREIIDYLLDQGFGVEYFHDTYLWAISQPNHDIWPLLASCITDGEITSQALKLAAENDASGELFRELWQTAPCDAHQARTLALDVETQQYAIGQILATFPELVSDPEVQQVMMLRKALVDQFGDDLSALSAYRLFVLISDSDFAYSDDLVLDLNMALMKRDISLLPGSYASIPDIAPTLPDITVLEWLLFFAARWSVREIIDFVQKTGQSIPMARLECYFWTPEPIAEYECRHSHVCCRVTNLWQKYISKWGYCRHIRDVMEAGLLRSELATIIAKPRAKFATR